MKPIVSALALIVLAAAPALARDYSADGVKIGHPWSRPAAEGGVGAGFMTIENTAATAVVFVGIETPRARMVELHQSVEKNGVYSMKALPGGVTIAPHAVLTLAPGGYHAMMMGLSARTSPGDEIPATLIFRRGGKESRVAVEFDVRAAAP